MSAWPRRAFRAQSEVAEAEDDLGRSGVTTLLSGQASASLSLPGLPAAAMAGVSLYVRLLHLLGPNSAVRR